MQVLQQDRAIAVNKEARLIYQGEKRILNETVGSSVTLARYFHRGLFLGLRDQWLKDTINYSAPADIFGHPAYQQILGYGEIFVEFILEDLPNAPFHWFGALAAISGENPVEPIHLGDVDAMIEDWTKWGENNEIL